MIFDWTISIGNIIMLISLVIGGIYAITTIKFDMRLIGSRVQRAELDLGAIITKMDGLTTVMIQIAQQEERIKALDVRVTLIATAMASDRGVHAYPLTTDP